VGVLRGHIVRVGVDVLEYTHFSKKIYWQHGKLNTNFTTGG